MNYESFTVSSISSGEKLEIPFDVYFDVDTYISSYEEIKTSEYLQELETNIVSKLGNDWYISEVTGFCPANSVCSPLNEIHNKDLAYLYSLSFLWFDTVQDSTMFNLLLEDQAGDIYRCRSLIRYYYYGMYESEEDFTVNYVSNKYKVPDYIVRNLNSISLFGEMEERGVIKVLQDGDYAEIYVFLTDIDN